MTGPWESVLKDLRLHDGRLTGMVVESEGLNLICESVDGLVCTLRLSRLVRLIANNFRQGNIIFDVSCFAGGTAPDRLLRLVFEATSGRDDEWFTVERARVHSENWTLLVLESSYGCDLLALSQGPLEIINS